MVGAYHLIIVHCLNKGDIPLFNGIDDRGGKLEIDVVHMNDVRLELVKQLAKLSFCLG